ncbi:MAG: hypothetical protein ACI4SY_05470 [Sutterella sp.]
MFAGLKVGGKIYIIAAALIGVAAVFMAGYHVASIRYERDIADGMAAAHKTARVIERASAEKMIGALNDRIEKLQQDADLARTERDDARRIADGLRRQNTARVPAAAGDPCRALREENARLRSLVAEGVELLQEGREGWRSASGGCDSLIDAIK